MGLVHIQQGAKSSPPFLFQVSFPVKSEIRFNEHSWKMERIVQRGVHSSLIEEAKYLI
jgi:hypothetical protein